MKQYLYGLLVVLLMGSVAAHEVYVLDSTTLHSSFGVHGINVFDALNDPGAFRWFVIGASIAVLGFIFLSYVLHTKLSAKLDKHFATLRQYAHLIIRVGLGVSFAWGAYHNSIFGPEIPLHTIPGGMLWKPVLFMAGLMLIFGAFTRIAAFIALIAFATVASTRGIYMMNYLNYFGEIVVLLLERGVLFSVDEYVQWKSELFHHKLPHWITTLERWGEKYSFPIIRITFGIALIWAALTVKIFYPAVSLEVLHAYSLDAKVAFTALFVVLVAGIIEIVLGLVLVTGILYRPTLVILVFFVGYSVWFFGEDVWPHAILVALSIGLFLHGKDRLSLEDWFFKKTWGWTNRFRKNKNPLSPE
jgi:uncharacterized membrane protein YphA (DoxX/SURF4 family)